MSKRLQELLARLTPEERDGAIFEVEIPEGTALPNQSPQEMLAEVLMRTHANLEQAQNAWVSFQNHAHIKRPETMSEYLELHALLENLTNRYAFADPTFEPLIDLIARYMLEWENANDPWALTPSTPRDALASLMPDRGTTQVQLEKAGVVASSWSQDAPHGRDRLTIKCT
jgi:hypothetical protein